MKFNSIFLGNIMKIELVPFDPNSLKSLEETDYSDFSTSKNSNYRVSVYKENACLYKIKDNMYVDMDKIRNYIDLFKLQKQSNEMKLFAMGDPIMLEGPSILPEPGDLFVNSLSPFPNSENKENISLFKIKKATKKQV